MTKITKRYDLIMFDLDGTILDTVDDLQDSLNYALNKHGFIGRSREDTLAFLGNGVEKLVQRALPDGVSKDTSAACLSDFKEHLEANNSPKTAPYKGIMPMLNQLKSQGYKLAVVSNKYHEAAVPLVKAHFGDIFDAVLGSSPQWGTKPSPNAINKILNDLGTDKDRAVLVGDTEVDAQTALNAGVDFIAVTWGFRAAKVFDQFSPVVVAGQASGIIDFLDNV